MDTTYKVLVADDCTATRMIVRDILKDMPVKIIESSNGEEAVAMVMREHPNLVLLDIGMPKKDGFDVLAELAEENFHVPIVVISTDNTNSTKEMCNSFGVLDVLEKPIAPALLHDIVCKYL